MVRPLFTSRTLAVLDRQNEANLPHLCQDEAQSAVDDGEGGELVEWVESGDPIACRVSPLGTAVERLRADQLQQDARYLVVFGAGVQVDPSARLRIDLDGEELLLDPHGSNGPRSYEVQRKYECGLWKGNVGEDAPAEDS